MSVGEDTANEMAAERTEYVAYKNHIFVHTKGVCI